MDNEFELKFLNIDTNETRNRLKNLGFSKSKPRTLMKRQTYHLPKSHPEYESKWGRVRDEGDRVTATIKWYDKPERPSISEVHENEIIAQDWQHGADWIMNQGFTPTALQENYREIWTNAKMPDIEISIDTWPGLNPYIEIEAKNEERVVRLARDLGFQVKNSFAGGTEIVYEELLGIPSKTIKSLSEITFQNPPKYK
ncbi:MAG: hypothetical protein Roseis2KO_07340 [Roseivirga sp.]